MRASRRESECLVDPADRRDDRDPADERERSRREAWETVRLLLEQLDAKDRLVITQCSKGASLRYPGKPRHSFTSRSWTRSSSSGRERAKRDAVAQMRGRYDAARWTKASSSPPAARTTHSDSDNSLSTVGLNRVVSKKNIVSKDCSSRVDASLVAAVTPGNDVPVVGRSIVDTIANDDAPNDWIYLQKRRRFVGLFPGMGLSGRKAPEKSGTSKGR